MYLSKLLLVDVDNVMFDFNTSFYDWMEREKNHQPKGERNSEYLFEKLYGVSSEQMHDYILEFSSNDLFATLPPMEGCVDAVRSLRSAGFTFEAITACCDTPEVRRGREKALNDVYGITDIHYVGLGNSKFDLLRRYKPSIWVEDNLKNALDGSMAGHYTFLIDHGYNRQANRGIHRVKGWSDIELALVEMSTK